MKPLPATLRAIALDPDAGPDPAAGVCVLPWQTDPTNDRRRTAEVTRAGVPIALLEVTETSPGFWAVFLWHDQGRREWRRGDRSDMGWSYTLETALADAEECGVAFAIGHQRFKPRRPRAGASR